MSEISRAKNELARIIKLREAEIDRLLKINQELLDTNYWRDKLVPEIDRLVQKLDDINQLLDQLPDPDQPSYDLQRDYRGWLAGLDEELKCH